MSTYSLSSFHQEVEPSPGNWPGFCDYFDQQSTIEVILCDFYDYKRPCSFLLALGILPVESFRSHVSSPAALRLPCCKEAQTSLYRETLERPLREERGAWAAHGCLRHCLVTAVCETPKPEVLLLS